MSRTSGSCSTGCPQVAHAGDRLFRRKIGQELEVVPHHPIRDRHELAVAHERELHHADGDVLAADVHPDVTGRAGHPKNIIFLTADAFGVLPPIARLSPDGGCPCSRSAAGRPRSALWRADRAGGGAGGRGRR